MGANSRCAAALMAICSGSALAQSALAQTPDVLVKVDLRPTFVSGPNRELAFRSYDLLGQPSTVALHFILEPGFVGVLSQRLERYPNGTDPDQLDEYIIEDPGYWRIGKQYLPFGQSLVLRESVLAGRFDTAFGGDAVPASLAACDAGSGRQRGFVGRLGGKLGISFAYGQHFGIASTALTVIREPDASPGIGRGFGRAVGVDYATRARRWGASVEVVAFRSGETPLDKDFELSDLYLFAEDSRYRRVGIGWSRDWRQAENVFRLDGRFLVLEGLWAEPAIRLRGGRISDIAFTLNAKL